MEWRNIVRDPSPTLRDALLTGDWATPWNALSAKRDPHLEGRDHPAMERRASPRDSLLRHAQKSKARGRESGLSRVPWSVRSFTTAVTRKPPLRGREEFLGTVGEGGAPDSKSSKGSQVRVR